MLAWSPPTVTNDKYDWSNTIFKFFKIPDGMDLTDCIMTIRKRAYPFELTFTNYDVLQYAIKTFSNIYLDKWNYMLKTTTLNYDPLKDFSEVWTEEKNGTFTRTDSTSGNDESSTYKTAYNTNDKQLTGSSDSTSKASLDRTDKDINSRNIDISGSTGRLTPAEMIQNERDIYLNIYNMIADDFINEFCILIY